MKADRQPLWHRSYLVKSLLIVCAILGVWFGVAGLFAVQLIRGMMTDYSEIPPAILFSDVFQSPLPNGVKRVTVAGHGFAGGQMFWMRMEADRATTQAMKRWGDDIDYATFESMTRASSDRRYAQERQSQGWEDSRWFRHFILRQFSTRQGKIRTPWIGVLAIDEVNRVIYVQAQG